MHISNDPVKLMYDQRTIAVIATERKAAHLALQPANKLYIPVLALTDDRTLTGANIPWIFRLPAATPLEDALRCVREASRRAGPNRQRVRDLLALSF
jgi:hypothetical protein